MKRILVEPYDTAWALKFAALKDRLKSALGPLALRVALCHVCRTLLRATFVLLQHRIDVSRELFRKRNPGTALLDPPATSERV